MKFQRFSTKEVDERRRMVEDIIRTRYVTTVPQIHQILVTDYKWDVSLETVRNDLNHINAMKDTRTDAYILADTQINRLDLYGMLKHACIFLLNDMRINRAGDTIFLYPDIGTAKRFQYFLEALRQDEQLAAKKKSFKDNILGVMSSEDVVMIHFDNGTDGRKFYKKLEVLSKQTEELDWTESPEELNIMKQTMGMPSDMP